MAEIVKIHNFSLAPNGARMPKHHCSVSVCKGAPLAVSHFHSISPKYVAKISFKTSVISTLPCVHTVLSKSRVLKEGARDSRAQKIPRMNSAGFISALAFVKLFVHLSRRISSLLCLVLFSLSSSKSSKIWFT